MGRIYRALEIINNGKIAEVVALVDTGSDRTILSERVANLVGLSGDIKDRIQVANGEIIEARLGEARVVSYRDGIDVKMDMDITNVPFDIDYEEGIDMIIGVDFLQEHNIKLIFEK